MPKVLIVEDNLINLRIFRTALERHGFSVLTATTSQEAVQLSGEHAGQIDLLVADIVLRQGDGSAVATATLIDSRVPVLYVSGSPLQRFLDSGVLRPNDLCVRRWAFLAKPFSPATLVKAVASLLTRNAVASGSKLA
jgi:CheY-like chemotaxis protein